MSIASQPTDPLNQVLNCQAAPFVPVAPVYEGLGPLEFYRMELRWRKWWARLDEARTDLLPVNYQTHFELELAIHVEILDRYYRPPAWLSLPAGRTRAEIAGSAVVRRGEDLLWLSADGEERWMAPNRAAYHEALAAERSLSYAQLWERGHRADRLPEAAARQHELAPVPEQAESLLDSEQYDIARNLLGRYPGLLPLYWYCSSPYNSLLGLLGFQQMMSALIEEPDWVHSILKSNLPRQSARLAAARRLGVGIVFMEECLASADLISPRMYQEFVFPYTEKALQFYEQMGFRTVLYFSGNLMPLLHYLKELPFTALSFEEDRKGYGIDLAEVRRALGPGRVLFGNVDACFVERASDVELLEEVKRQIEVGGKDGNFVLSAGSPLTPGTSLDRVRLFCESTRMI